MAELSIDWVMVRDGERTLWSRNCSSWDRATFLAALSSDPRTFQELSIAWSRFREEPLAEMTWQALDETAQAPAGWLCLDLSHQQFAFIDTDPDDSDELTPGAYRHDDSPQKKQTIWLNIPPWWRRLQVTNQAEFLEQSRLVSTQWIPPFDFREVLYGRELASEIAQQVLAIQWPAAPPNTATEGGVPQVQPGRFDDDALIRKLNRRVLRLVQRVHVNWLMTPRPALNGRTPREFLHEYREWKDRELDYRRAQWSRTRVAPPAVPRESMQFQFGPMGTEEVVMYFDMVRDLIMAAWRWVDDDPRITHDKLTEELILYIIGWLSSPDPEEGSGELVREIIDLERSLTPRLASNEPIDCDCPLCRLQASQELFGPAFSICDGYHLEMEDEFAFSLETDRDMWESSRTSPGDSFKPDDSKASETSIAVLKGPLTSPSNSSVANEDAIWTSSHVDPNPAPLELSLFAIGARLAELIDRMKSLNAPRKHINDLNDAFDEMSVVIRNWIVDKVTGKTDEGEAMSQVVDRMIAVLEACALTVPEITSQSADLQSLVHEWQRQLQKS